MSSCDRIRPLLFPYIEREAAPAEAMLVAKHLSACTACKILIARKGRLASMLENGLADRIPVGEEFVRSVMATLPEGPPPLDGRSGRKRHLKIAGTLGLALLVASAMAARLPAIAIGHVAAARLPGLDAQTGNGPYEAVLEIARGALVAIAGAPLDLSVVVPSLGWGVSLALLVLGALAASSGLVALAAGSILGLRRV